MGTVYSAVVFFWPITDLVVTNRRALPRYCSNGIFCAGCGLEGKVSNQDVTRQFFSGTRTLGWAILGSFIIECGAGNRSPASQQGVFFAVVPGF